MPQTPLRLALDTNFLGYAGGLALVAADLPKIASAVRLTEAALDDVLVVSRQALLELHYLLVRKGRLDPRTARHRLSFWLDRAEVVDTGKTVFDGALDLVSAHGLRIFDAVILSAAAEARCDLLLSEDLQDGFVWRGVTVSNPFGAAPDRRLKGHLA